MSAPPDYEQLATKLAHMSRDLLRQQSVQDTLNQIVEHAVDIIDGCTDAGLLLLRSDNRLETPAATSDRVRESDRAQGALGEGPCLDAAKEGEAGEQVYRIADLTQHEDRWPRYTPWVRDLGIGSMMGFRLFTEKDNLGALDIYSEQPNMFTERSEQAGLILASHAAVAFSNARTEADLYTAISTRQVIGEALGILMERHKIPEQEAFDKLKKSSQQHNTKLRDIARQVTETGELPE